jgi:hypothetical protein
VHLDAKAVPVRYVELRKYPLVDLVAKLRRLKVGTVESIIVEEAIAVILTYARDMVRLQNDNAEMARELSGGEPSRI